MTRDAKRFQTMEKMMTRILIFAAILFFIYLISAGSGVIWLKVVTAIFTILICGLCLFYLYMTKLLTRPKTLWMTLAAACIIICLVFSLALNFPSKL